MSKNVTTDRDDSWELEVPVKAYHVEPFYPIITDKQARKAGAGAVSEQMQVTNNRFAADGWTFERYDGVQTAINSVCLWMIGSRA